MHDGIAGMVELSEHTDRTQSARADEAGRRSRVGISIAADVLMIVVLMIAVIDNSFAVAQTSSPARMFELVVYAIGFAAACLSLWRLLANR